MRFSVKIFFLIYHIFEYPEFPGKISVGKLYPLFLTSKNALFVRKNTGRVEGRP
jgi:hypothetical protein